MSVYVQDQLQKAGDTSFASAEAEQAILFVLVSSDRDTSTLTSTLSEADFAFDDHGKLFAAIKATVAKRQHVDLVTVDATLAEMYPLEATPLTQKLMACAHCVAWHNVDDYITILQTLSARRRILRALSEIADQLRDPSQDMTEILDKLRAQTSDAGVGKHTWQSMSDVLLKTYEYMEKRSTGSEKAITTGILNVDALVGGFYGGELTVIGARPSVGKSAFGANIALEAARQGFRVAVVSREMSDVQFGQRLLARQSNVDGMRMRKAELTPEDWCALAGGMDALSSLPISFLFTVRTVEDLRAEAQRRVNKGELDMLIIDYLQLMHTARRFREEHLRVGYISKALKDMAVDFNIPVIALAQVNRDTDGQMPTLKSLKASGDIEQDADGVIFLHRPANAKDAYVDPRDREYFDTYEQKDLVYICIGVAKQRQGAVGKACVLFNPAIMRYYTIDRDTAPNA